MKHSRIYLSLFLLLVLPSALSAQKPYHVRGGEWILSGSQVVSDGTRMNTNSRFTVFFHLEEEIHMDLTDNIGLFTGIGLRNIGLILDDYYAPAGENAKIVHRSFSLGLPGALKIGSFSKGYFVYGGAELEYLFHYKQKMFLSDTKSKFSEWNSERVNLINPSVFVGFQFPGGINLKAKYYLHNFLNPAFTGRDFSYAVDYSMYEQTSIFYLSISFKIKASDLKKILDEETKTYNAAL